MMRMCSFPGQLLLKTYCGCRCFGWLKTVVRSQESRWNQAIEVWA
jgi:hypothetical protein